MREAQNCLPPPPAAQAAPTLVFKLSSDAAERAVQLKHVRKTLIERARKRAVENSVDRMTPTYENCQGGCGWETIAFGMDFGFDGPVQVAEKVIITGISTCSITIGGALGEGTASCDEAGALISRTISRPNLGRIGASTAEFFSDIAGAIADEAIGLVSPLGPKCAKTPATNPVQTPDQDRAKDYYVARASILDAYAGNRGFLRLGARVDVFYPSGWTTRFLVVSSFPPDAGGVDPRFKIEDIGNPMPSETPCKP